MGPTLRSSGPSGCRGLLTGLVESENGVKLSLQFFVRLKVGWIDERLERVLLLPDHLQLGVVVEQRTGLGELRLVVVAVTLDLTDLELEVSPRPEVERVHWRLVIELRVHHLVQLVKDLLAVAEELDLPVVLGVGLIVDDVYVRDETELALLSASLLPSRRVVVLGDVPELGVHLTDRIGLAEGRQGVLDVPLAGRTLEAVGPYANERHVLVTWSRKEPDDCVAVARLVGVGVPEAVVVLRRLVALKLGELLRELFERVLGTVA